VEARVDKRQWARLSAAGGLVLAAGMGARNVAANELKVGDAAPAFKLQGSDGKVYDLEAFRGRQVVVLAWFPKAFTGG